MTELMINRPVRGLLAVLVTGGCGAFPPMTRAQEAVAAPPSALCLAASYTGDFRRNTTGGLAAGSAYADAMDLGIEWTSGGLSSRATLWLSVLPVGQYVHDPGMESWQLSARRDVKPDATYARADE